MCGSLIRTSFSAFTDISCMNAISLTHPVKAETASLDATKNELLTALDLRLAALKEELIVAFNSAASATCFGNQIFDLASFAQHFGATELRKSLLKFLELCPNIHAIDSLMHRQTNDSVNINRMETKSFSLKEKTDVVKAATANVFPAKVVQAEQESSSEIADSSDSSDGDNPSAERSRLVVRSAAPRRSASPMRRIQIGRAGSRRSLALTIKSLNYFQSLERAISNRDADAREKGEEELEHLPKKPENNGRMSVKDAINLFESKQTVQNSDSQKRKTSEVSISANKSVLRRWSSGMGDSCNYSTKENPLDSSYEIALGKLDPEREDKKENDLKDVPSNPEFAPICMAAEIVGTVPLQGTIPTETVLSTEGVDSKDQSSAADWNRQKEAELNDMRKKMMIGNNPTKYSTVEVSKDEDVLKDTSLDQRGGFYSQYSERRNRKLRSENARNHGKEEQFKLTHVKPGKNKAAMASRVSGSALKRESTTLSGKPRKISSPPVLSKKEIFKPTNKNKVSSKSSSSLQTRSSFPLGSSEKVVDTLPAKSPPTVSTGSISSRQKSQSSISPALPSPRIKNSQHMENYNSATSVQASIKPSLFGKEHKIVKLVKKNSTDVKSRNPFSREDCGTFPSKSTVQGKYTRKSSVVPLESKLFLRKGSGIIPVNGPLAAKTKDARVSKPSDSLKNIENIVLPDEQEFNHSQVNSTIKVIEDLVQPTNVVDKTLAAPHDNESDNIETMDSVDGSLTIVDTDSWSLVEFTITENHKDNDLGISSAARAEAENEEYSVSSNNKQHHVVSPIIAPVSSSSPLVRHSLSQMLQADNSGREISEWGNAENPPSLVYQKDAPKGLKRLLMFARKSKGEDNLSPSVFSEGEEEDEESKAPIRSSDAPLQKPSFQAQGYGQPKGLVSESLDLGRSIKKAMEHKGVQDDLSAGSAGSEKLRNAHFSTGVAASKATRSFFSLSSFRSGKSSETNPR
ncbi:LOW QUALITY PROTEIN: uncharacterized protein LOC110029812 [Phalaenopsis equestris]|uniref:LOW QUALITY PROTEIN: uncharacterized protein LOC110029812 n=1 Tax=Phalaenopsis equestris TaxID=78828 RepID=UPI0009E428C7|nr:LOW QUALITY PROTEIN: uncharacterized protein LOC110029812 [Phalaenopsis equestris]